MHEAVSDLSGFEAARALVRRKYHPGQRTVVFEHATPATIAFPDIAFAFAPEELAILAGYRDCALHERSFVLTTRHVLAPSQHKNRDWIAFPYSQIQTWETMPFPRTAYGDFYRLKVAREDGDILFLEGEPGSSFSAALAVISNRVHAYQRR